MKRKFQIGDPVYARIIRWWPGVVIGYAGRRYVIQDIATGDIDSYSRRNVIARNG